jgi:hypothetical protein
MELEVESHIAMSERVSRAIVELKALQDPLLSGEVDPETLTDFRDALNRVRNTAWAAQQSAAAPLLEQDSAKVSSLLASERIRAAYQLCLSIREDVGRNEIELQKGQLLELYEVAKALVAELKRRVRRIQ